MTLTLLIILFIPCIGGVFFLAWQNQQLRQKLVDTEERFFEKYQRLQQEFNHYTTQTEHQHLELKMRFLNEQLSAAIQEISILKTHNQYKMSPQELAARNSEHLEVQNFNPDIKIYYAKWNADKHQFDSEDFRTEPSIHHFYKIEVNLNQPEQAKVSIVSRSEYHYLALANPHILLDPVCQYEQKPYNDQRILTDIAGTLKKKDSAWTVREKVVISFS